MNKTTIGKYAMTALGLVLTVAGTMVNGKLQDKKMEETIAKKVAEALENQAKEV